MSTATSPEVETEPATDEAPPCWPPLAHLIRKEDRPAKPGMRALCGAKLMGLDLGDLRTAQNVKLCEKCVAEFKRIYGDES